MAFPKKMPHLKGALEMNGAPGQRLCVHCAAGFVLDTPGAEFVCGVFHPDLEKATGPNDSRVPFIHAWAEYRGAVWSPTAIEQMGGLKPMNAAGYYAVNGATNIKRLSRPALLAVAKRIGLSRHLRLGVPAREGVSVGGSILDAAGQPWKVGPDGAGLLPRETVDG